MLGHARSAAADGVARRRGSGRTGRSPICPRRPGSRRADPNDVPDLALLRRTFVLADEARRSGGAPYGALVADADGKVIAEHRNTAWADGGDRRDLTSAGGHQSDGRISYSAGRDTGDATAALRPDCRHVLDGRPDGHSRAGGIQRHQMGSHRAGQVRGLGGRQGGHHSQRHLPDHGADTDGAACGRRRCSRRSGPPHDEGKSDTSAVACSPRMSAAGSCTWSQIRV